MPDAVQVVLDRAVGREEAAAGHVEDGRPHPGVLVEVGLVHAVLGGHVAAEVSEHQEGVVVEQRIQVEVAFAREDDQALLAVEGAKGMTVREAIERSGILKRFPEIDLDINKVGIFGKLATLEQALETGDRVEIYRPLVADPKAQRKKRAAEGKVMRKGAGVTEN